MLSTDPVYTSDSSASVGWRHDDAREEGGGRGCTRRRGHKGTEPGRARDVHGSEDARVKAQKPERERAGMGTRGGGRGREQEGWDSVSA